MRQKDYQHKVHVKHVIAVIPELNPVGRTIPKRFQEIIRTRVQSWGTAVDFDPIIPDFFDVEQRAIDELDDELEYLQSASSLKCRSGGYEEEGKERKMKKKKKSQKKRKEKKEKKKENQQIEMR